MANECFFKFKFQCDGRQEKLTESGLNRIENIIRCSKIYLDSIDKPLENSLRENRDFTIKNTVKVVCRRIHLPLRYRDISNELSKLKNLLWFLKRKQDLQILPPLAFSNIVYFVKTATWREIQRTQLAGNQHISVVKLNPREIINPWKSLFWTFVIA